jgi:hypothetical protein
MVMPGGCELKPSEECECICHTGGAVHPMPCCNKCGYCGKNIKLAYWGEHFKKHMRKEKEIEEGAKERFFSFRD